nr:putative RNA-directed DNA polymerase, eukaryota, reverse transcriptase zinc-binding domain protein [Tanacetum cinerariifolium]
MKKNESLLDSVIEKVQMLKSKAENDGLNNEEIAERLSCLKNIQELEHKENMDLLQKAKIKWAIEGDESFKFFHRMLNNKFTRSRINGLFINSNWISDPHLVTSHIFNFHKTKFQKSSIILLTFTSIHFKSLSMSESASLDAPFTMLEIKDVVWSCGVPKTNDPLHIKDYRPISLIRCLYKVIAKLHANRLVKVVGSIVSEVQTTFIKGRKIIDGPLMVNEILSWAGKNKERLFMLKVDFEKAFDTLDWDFLDLTMKQMGFSTIWRKRIQGCLDSTYASVIINGSPTKEFKIQKGLRQGNPLSPFLFIIAIEALHVSIQEAKSKNIFKGVKVRSANLDISHFQFADDALILGKWSLENGKNLCRILRCFHLASELKVNFSKSKFFDETSFGGAPLTLKKCHGYLGRKCVLLCLVGVLELSLHASNLAMLVKWHWRFYNEKNALWRRLITSIHGTHGGGGGLDQGYHFNSIRPSTWKTIIGVNNPCLIFISTSVLSLLRKLETGFLLLSGKICRLENKSWKHYSLVSSPSKSIKTVRLWTAATFPMASYSDLAMEKAG